MHGVFEVCEELGSLLFRKRSEKFVLRPLEKRRLRNYLTKEFKSIQRRDKGELVDLILIQILKPTAAQNSKLNNSRFRTEITKRLFANRIVYR